MRMRLYGAMEDILGSKVKISILRLLCRTHGMYSGREISRLIGFSPTHTIANLRELEAAGLVLRQRAGRTDLYRLNEENSAVNRVLGPIYDWESGLPEELAGMYVERLKDHVVSLRLFGSAARGEEETGSDVDLLLILSDAADLREMEGVIAEIDVEAGRKLGLRVSTICVTEKEYARKTRSARGFWKGIREESKVIYERKR